MNLHTVHVLYMYIVLLLSSIIMAPMDQTSSTCCKAIGLIVFINSLILPRHSFFSFVFQGNRHNIK